MASQASVSANYVTKKHSRRTESNSQEVRLSKTLSWLLRHGADKVGLNVSDDGFARVNCVLGLPQFTGVSFDQLNNVVANNNKQRFSMEQRDGEWWIRANQGHSTVAVPNLALTPINASNLDRYPVVVHGTRYSLWPAIRKSGGLSKMNRQHIHLAQGMPGDHQVQTTSQLQNEFQQNVTWVEKELLKHLMKGYTKDLLPTFTGGPILVTLKPQLLTILDLDEKRQTMEYILWWEMFWVDDQLRWEPDRFNGMTRIVMPAHYLWQPDITMMSQLSSNPVIPKEKINAWANFDGSVYMSFVAVVNANCILDVSTYPFDNQTCNFVSSSWMHPIENVIDMAMGRLRILP